MKKLAALVLIISVLFTVSSFGAKIDNEEIKSTLLNGTTMAPLEDMAKLLNLEFCPTSGAYSVSEKNDVPRMLVFKPDKPDTVYAQCYIKQNDGSLKLTDEEQFILPEEIVRIDGKLYVPFRFVLEYFNANVYWTKEDGAYAYRTSYGEPALIKTDGVTRERVSLKGSFENAFIAEGYIVLIRGGELYKVNPENGEETLLGESGRVYIEKEKLFVFKSGKLTIINVLTGEKKEVTNDLTMVGYLAEGGAWCEKGETASVYDSDGNFVTEITGKFYNPWEYSKGYVYYLTEEMEMRRAKADGSEDEPLIKIALYPEWIDGYIYYSDSAMNYRRFDVETGEDIMVYGLNLEQVLTFGEKYIFNFYDENTTKLFISNPDGTALKPFGGECEAISGTPALYKEGIAAKGIREDFVYYITENETVKLSDDEIFEFLGVIDGFVYYTVR